MKIKSLADDVIPNGCLVPVVWTTSVVLLPDGEPHEHSPDGTVEFLTAVEAVDPVGRPLKGVFIPKGTRAVINWSEDKLGYLPSASQMYFHHKGQICRRPACGACGQQRFIEIAEDAAGLNRQGLMRWLSAAYDDRPYIPSGGESVKAWTHDSDKKWRA